MSIDAPPQRVTPQSSIRPPAEDGLIADRLRDTRRRLRAVDLAAGGLRLAVAVIVYLFLAALADHWLVRGGLTRWERILAWLPLAAGGAAYLWLRILRPLLWGINPVYVAQTIEHARPTLKNGLINLLLLRRERQPVLPAVNDAIQRHAAIELAHVSPDAAVDNRHVLVLCYVLTALVAIGGLYHILSPKNPLVSALRVAMPWAGFEAPTRVRFDDVRPRDVAAFRGEHVVVSAEVTGLRTDERAMLYFTTADRQSVDQAVPMTPPPGGYRHEAKLPPESRGLQQNLTYYLAAGDYRSPEFTITVQTAPTILVESIEYRYPDYTALADRTVRGQGDVRALEGTRVTVRAKANTSIDWAEIDLGCRGVRGVPMSIKGREATGSFTLRPNRDKPTLPEYDCYQLRFADAARRENRRPIRHQIDVIPDLPPNVALVDPPEDGVELPVNAVLPLTVQAEDPDFGLREVAFRAVCSDRSLPIRPLLEPRTPSPAHQGPFEGTSRFEPARLGLKPGDEVDYWAEAKDDKYFAEASNDQTPLRGLAQTERRRIKIVEPSSQQPPDQPQDRQPQDQQPKPQERQPEDDQGQGRGAQANKPQEQPSKPPQPGDQGRQDQPPDEQKPDQKKPDDRPETGQQSEEKQQDQPSETKEPSEGQQDQTKDEQDQTKDQQDQGKDQQDTGGQDDKQSGRPQSDAAGQNQGDQQKKTGEEQPSEPVDGQTNPGDVIQKALEQREKDEQQQTPQAKPQPSEKQQPTQPGQESSATGQPQPGGQQPGEDQSKGQKPGDTAKPGQQSDDQKPGGQPSDSQKPGGEQSAEQKSGGEQPGEPKPTGQESSANKPSEQPSDEKPAGGQPSTTEPNAADKPAASDSSTEPPQEAQGQPTGGGRRLDPDEIDPNKPIEPSGFTNEAPNAQARARFQPGQGDKPGPGQPVAGGKPGEFSPPPAAPEPGEDPFDRRYAEKQTILALEYIKDQLAKEKPNQKLLDALGGWTRDDLGKFTQRWEAMFRQAQQPGAEGQEARAELDEAIKSLGLHRGAAVLRGGTIKNESGRLRDTRRIAPPPEWEEQDRAYHRAIGRGE